MAARFWVTGGTGNWNSTTNWSATSGGASGASVPGSADTATFDASSGSGTATLDISPDIQTLTMTGFTGTLAFGTNTISLNSTGTIFTGATTMTVTGTPLIICTNSSATARTISPQVVTEANSISFRVTAGTGGFTVTTTHAVRDLDFTDGVNPTGFAGAYGNVSNTIFGNFKASTGMTRTAGTGTLTFAATSGTKTINTAGVTFDCPFTFNGVGGTFRLQSALTSGATRTCTLTNGTLDLASYTLTTGLFSSTNSNVRTLAFGTGKIVLTATSGTIFTTGTFANLTVTGTSLVQATNGGAGTRSLTSGTGAISEANAINFEITSGSDIVSLTGTGGAVRNINFTGFTGTIDIPSTKVIYGNLDAGSATSITGTSVVTFAATSGTKTIRTNGLTYGGGFVFNGVGGAWSLQDALTLPGTTTLTAGTLDLNGFTLTTSTFTGTGSVVRRLVTNSVPIVVTGSGATVVNFGTTTNLTVDVTPTFNLTYSGSVGTRTISVGATTNLPAAPNITVTAGSDIVTTSGTTTLTNLIFTSGFTGTLGNGTRNIYGNLTLVSGMATPTSGSLVTTFNGVGSQTITTAGQTLDFPITFDGIGGTWTLQDALTSGATRTCTLSNGTLDLNGYTLTAGGFASNNSNVRAIAFGTGKIVVTTTTGTPLSMSTATNFTYTGTSRIEVTASGAGRTITPTATNAIASNALNIYVTTGSDTLTVSGSARFLNFDLTGFAGTLTYASSTRYFGDLVFSSGMTLGTVSGSFTFAKTSGTQTITTAGKTIGNNVTVDAPGAIVSLQDALSLTGTLTLTNGTLQLRSGVTSTVGGFATSGTNQKFLQSNAPGVQATLSAASGTVDVSYLTIQDSAATGGATWLAYVGNLNIDAGNNTGWVFFNNVYARTVTDSATVTDLADVAATVNATIVDAASLLDSTSSAFLWNLIDDAQTPNWQNINNDQLPGWQDIDTL